MLKQTNLISRRTRRTAPELPWQVVVVGAGPAGLFAALSLVAGGLRRVLLLDAGPDIQDRSRAPRRSPASKATPRDYERGMGGAGLFSDGKLCLSLGVGGHLDEALDNDRRQRLEQQIADVLLGFVDGPVEYRHAGPGVELAGRAAAAAGLDFKFYPVAHIGTDRCTDVVVRLRDAIAAAGVAMRSGCELTNLAHDERTGRNIATVRTAEGAQDLEAEHVVLAMGKVGAERQAQLCRKLGIGLSSQRLYAGVRVEAPAEAVAPLFHLTKDPKYSLRFPDGTKIKTHCASQQGEVLTLRYSGLPLAGGHNYAGPRTARSGFSILWDGVEPGSSAYETAQAMMRAAAGQTGGQLLAQRLSDLRIGQASRSDDVAALLPTCEEAVAGDLASTLPSSFVGRMDQFLERLERLAPGLTAHDMIAYGPAIEWWMERVDVADAHMATSVPGVSVCGDGSGWSQGIVHAAATGLLAAGGIHGRDVDVSAWLARRATTPVAVGS